MTPQEAGLFIGVLGGTVGVIGTITTWLRGGFRHGFDSEKAQEDIRNLKVQVKDLEVQLEEEVKMLNLHIMKQVTEAKTSNLDALNAIRTDVGGLNRHIMDMTEKLGKLTGLIEGQNRRRDG